MLSLKVHQLFGVQLSSSKKASVENFFLSFQMPVHRVRTAGKQMLQNVLSSRFLLQFYALGLIRLQGVVVVALL